MDRKLVFALLAAIVVFVIVCAIGWGFYDKLNSQV